MSNPMPISEEKKQKVAEAARPLIDNYHAELLGKLDAVLAQKLSKSAEDDAIFLIIDSYQTAFVSMATHLNTLRTKGGGTTTMSINMPHIPGVSDIKPEGMS